MDDFDPAELARIRRFGHADWRRLAYCKRPASAVFAPR